MKDAPVLKEGDEMTARVIKVDKGERKIALSVKALHKDKAQNNDNDRTTLKDYMSQQEKPDTTIGALLKERS
jgi:ribosomal protein S1